MNSDEPIADVVVIGAGAAGLMAAIRCAESGSRVLLLEKNSKAGVKILMSGGTRCNLTHATTARGIAEAFGQQGHFLHSPLAAFPPDQLVDFFELAGLKTKVESSGKIFPVTDRALDVQRVLLRSLHDAGATLSLTEPVLDVQCEKQKRRLSVVTARRRISTESVIVTTGGQSYPGCGTTGDGYRWLTELGHTIVSPKPALVPVNIRADWAKALRGVTLPDVRVSVCSSSTSKREQPAMRLLAERRGGLLFTHFGLSGPAVMDVSRSITQHASPRSLRIVCDFLPDWNEQQFFDRIRTAVVDTGGRQVANWLADVLPRRLAESLCHQADVSSECRLAELSTSMRKRLLTICKQMPIPVTGTLGFNKAEVTAGGVALDEVNSRTMESRLVPGLYLAGEILDVDGPIGGYNFQAAFSTGAVAGWNAADD